MLPVAGQHVDKRSYMRVTQSDRPMAFEHFHQLLEILGYPLPKPFARLCWILLSAHMNPPAGDQAIWESVTEGHIKLPEGDGQTARIWCLLLAASLSLLAGNPLFHLEDGIVQEGVPRWEVD